VTTRTRLYGDSPGTSPDRTPIDLYLGIDCSGSMRDPALNLSYPILAATVVALSALRAGSRVMVALSGEPGKTITTEGFVRDERSVLGILTSYLGTGYAFGIHRLGDTFRDRPKSARRVHIVVVSDSDIYSILDQSPEGALGWDVARQALANARGGGTYVLQIDLHYVGAGRKDPKSPIGRMLADGWAVEGVDSMDQLLAFAKRFSQAKYGRTEKPKAAAAAT
jgi:hypothetical protein